MMPRDGLEYRRQIPCKLVPQGQELDGTAIFTGVQGCGLSSSSGGGAAVE